MPAALPFRTAPADIEAESLDEAFARDGFALLEGLVDPATCAGLAGLYDAESQAFRSTVIMARHGYGRGAYRYFDRPLPQPVQTLREDLYPPLARVANLWEERLGGHRRWPATQTELAAQCAAGGQTRPTPLLLRYGPGDYNRLHQDMYGPLAFPLQVIVLLDAPGRDFTGGELVLVEARPRLQSRAMVVPLSQGDAVVIPVRDRPTASARGWARATVRHGVSEIRTGARRTLGIIFHDAE